MNKQKVWLTRAIELLDSCLEPIPHELNELDWKVSLSEDKARLSEHLSAFANHHEGGFFIFGVDRNGIVLGIDNANKIQEINTKIANLARDSLEPSQIIDYQIIKYKGKNILITHVKESQTKPVHLRGKSIESSYIRSGGQTRKMNKQELAQALLSSNIKNFEDLIALNCSKDEIFNLIEYQSVLKLLKIPETSDQDLILEYLINNKLVYKNNIDYSISNLGLIFAANDFKYFPDKERFSIRVIKYRDNTRNYGDTERIFSRGYGVCFEEIISYIIQQLPTSEVLKKALREDFPMFPSVTIRELLANALIHRDFLNTKTHILIELFNDRMEITNPGALLPSLKIERLIDAPPLSRNEKFADLMRRAGVCESRGSGIDRALIEVEVYQLPPVKFIDGENYFKSIIYKSKNLSSMSEEERLRACYQHCCLKYAHNEKMTNASFRERLGLKNDQYQQSWKIINLAIENKLIKIGETSSKKHAYYLPIWAN